MTKTVDDPTPLVGDIVSFKVTATNNEPANATGLHVSDPIVPGNLHQPQQRLGPGDTATKTASTTPDPSSDLTVTVRVGGGCATGTATLRRTRSHGAIIR